MSNTTPNRIQNAGFVTNTTAASAPSLTTPSLNSAYLNQMVDVGGVKYFVDAYGVATKLDGSTSTTTTSLTPVVRSGGSDVNAQANATTTAADVLRLSDSSYVNAGKVTWTGHGLTVGSWYYTSQTTAGGYVTPAPAVGVIQQLFFVLDANTVLVNIEPATEISVSSSSRAVLRAQYTTSVSIAPSGYALGFSSVPLNTVPAAWNNSTGTFTAQSAGFYMVAVGLGASASVSVGQFLEVHVEKNGVTERSFLSQSNGIGTYNLIASGAVPVYLAVGDTIRFRFGASVTMTSHVNSTFFSITEL